jgi:hypothetical protein
VGDSADPDDGLPDARLADRSFGTIRGPGGNYEPVFCVYCGRRGGAVTAKWAEHIFYVCDECVRTHGSPPCEEVPENVVRANVKAEPGRE